MGFPARHPRYTIALVVLLFVSVLVFSNSDSSPAYLSRPYPLAFRKHGDRPPPSPGYVEDQIRTSEAYYQASLKERQKLITKWGPSPSQVDAFPSHGEFYTLCKNMYQRACDPTDPLPPQGTSSHRLSNARTGCNALAHLVMAVNGFVEWSASKRNEIALFIPSVRQFFCLLCQ